MSLFTELRRRNVFRVGLFYIVSAWLIIQVAETLLPMFDVPDGALRAIVVILALGFPLAVVFSWVFEMTPEGIKRDKDVRVDPETKQQTAQKLNWATLVAAVLAIGLLVADRLMPEAGPTVQTVAGQTPSASSGEAAGIDAINPASIAVLPFEDLSPSGNQGYFSDGIAEEILNVLVRTDGLDVASRTSAFRFRNSADMGIPDIAQALQVRHVLEGSVRKAGEAIRVTAQLIDGQSDKHLWSDTYDRSLTAENVFAIQEAAYDFVRHDFANLVDSYGDEFPRQYDVAGEAQHMPIASTVRCRLDIIHEDQTLRNRIVSNLARTQSLIDRAETELALLHEVASALREATP